MGRRFVEPTVRRLARRSDEGASLAGTTDAQAIDADRRKSRIAGEGRCGRGVTACTESSGSVGRNGEPEPMTEDDSTTVAAGTDADTTDGDRIEHLERTVETLVERVVELETERTGDDAGGSGPVSRRSVLGALGIAGLAGLGATTASADPQGQVGTQSDPLQTLYVEAIEGATVGDELTIGASGDRAATFRPHSNYNVMDVVLGFQGNSVTARGGTVGGGGEPNEANVADTFATVSGGRGNVASYRHSTIGGGFGNEANNFGTTIGGGIENTASHYEAAVGGGRSNTSSSNYTTVAGGKDNVAGGVGAAVGGGEANTANSYEATVGGGYSNTASGGRSVVPGGLRNTASGGVSFAAGVDATADGLGSFVWNDGSEWTSQNDFRASEAVSGEPVTGNETFNVSATGGARFVTGGNSVTYIESGTAGWSNTSTRAAKTGIEPVDPEAILQGVESLEVATWEYRDGGRADEQTEDGDDADDAVDDEETGTTRVGPFAEEFHDAFDVGGSDDHINSVDADGVALAAIQGLVDRLEDHEARVDEYAGQVARRDQRIDDLEAENEALRDRLDAIEDHLVASTAGNGR